MADRDAATDVPTVSRAVFAPVLSLTEYWKSKAGYLSGGMSMGSGGSANVGYLQREDSGSTVEESSTHWVELGVTTPPLRHISKCRS